MIWHVYSLEIDDGWRTSGGQCMAGKKAGLAFFLTLGDIDVISRSVIVGVHCACTAFFFVHFHHHQSMTEGSLYAETYVKFSYNEICNIPHYIHV